MSSQHNILELVEPMQQDYYAAQAGNSKDGDIEQSAFRASLYDYFPNQKEIIDEAFKEYNAFRSDGSDSNSAQSNSKAAGANLGFSQ